MWIKLTKSDDKPVLVNISKISGASPTKNGGSTIQFDERFTAPGSRLVVGETIEEVADMIGAPYFESPSVRAHRR